MDLLNYVQKGGPIMWILLFSNFISITFVFWKFISFKEQKKNIEITAKEILKNILYQTTMPPTQDVMLELCKDRSFSYVKTLGEGLGTIKTIATVSPLLGLLGTAVGVLSSFEMIAAQGLKNPESFSSGIAMALITTVGGLIVAIPNLMFYNFLSAMLTKFELDLETKITNVYLKNEYGAGES